MNRIKSVFLLTLSLLFIGCGGESSAPAPASQAPATQAPAPGAPADNNAALVAEGKTLFESTAICFSCHGQDAMGTALAPNLTDAEWLNLEAPITAEKLTTLIKNGVTEPKKHPAPMPPMSNLTDDQLQAIAAYVLSLGA